MYKPHAWVEINLDNIGYNLQLIKSKIKESIKLIGVVKADAYGFGAIEMARFLIKQGIDMLAVSILTEGIELRDAGITAPILLLNYLGIENHNLLVQYDLTPTLYNIDYAQELNNLAEKKDRIVEVQLNVDTGMSRLGILVEEMPKFLKRFKKFKNLKLTGVYSHFSTADSIDLDYTKKQLESFIYVKDLIITNGYTDVDFHIANSAALLRDIAIDYDYVRIGAAIYGFNLNNQEGESIFFDKLKASFSFKTLISHVKEVGSSVAVGYGASYKTKGITKIATIPIGYADGLRRSLSNKGEVLVNGKRAKIIGIVSMGQCMIDVTNIPKVNMGDEVTIIGRQKEEAISLADFARQLNTISYEVPVSINKRIPRYYIKNDRTQI